MQINKYLGFYKFFFFKSFFLKLSELNANKQIFRILQKSFF